MVFGDTLARDTILLYPVHPPPPHPPPPPPSLPPHTHPPRAPFTSLTFFNVSEQTCTLFINALEALDKSIEQEFTAVLHQVVKYGVIRKDSLCRDLLQWDTLYTAGRLQKPVLTLQTDPDVEKASVQNRMSALIASLLLLPKIFSEKVISIEEISLQSCDNIACKSPSLLPAELHLGHYILSTLLKVGHSLFLCTDQAFWMYCRSCGR